MARPDPATPRPLTLPVGPRDHARGPEAATITLLEYGDFECPQCGQAYSIVKELERRLGDRLRFVFRHFPLTNVHPNAQAAAEASEWAAAAGAFWPMHDALYEHGPKLPEKLIREIADELDAPRLSPGPSLDDAWRAHSHFARVKEDFRSGIASGVTGTPSFFIDGVRHEGKWDLDSLARALDEASARAQRSG